MTRDEAVVIIQQTLGFRSDLGDAIIRNLKLAQTNLELGPTLPWFLLSEESQTTTSADSHRVQIPDDFLREAEGSALIYRPDDSDEDELILGKRDYDWLLKEYPSVYETDDVRTPKYYALRGEYFMVFPKPDAEYILRMVYFKRDDVLSTDVENGWLLHAPLLLMGEAGLLLAPGLRDGNATQTFSQWRAAGRSALFTANEDREHANRDDYQMGGEE
jgi:hypothetical protein